MMTILAGEIWLANILFTDQYTAKRRPVLVLWLDGYDAVVAAITSAAPRSPTDIILHDWQSAGLRVPSTVRLARLDCLEQQLLLFRLGQISAADAVQVRLAWDTFVKPQF